MKKDYFKNNIVYYTPYNYFQYEFLKVKGNF